MPTDPTTYLIFETDQAAETLTRVNRIVATDADSAVRKHVGRPTDTTQRLFLALAESNAKLRQSAPRMIAGVSVIPWPDAIPGQETIPVEEAAPAAATA